MLDVSFDRMQLSEATLQINKGLYDPRNLVNCLGGNYTGGSFIVRELAGTCNYFYILTNRPSNLGDNLLVTINLDKHNYCFNK